MQYKKKAFTAIVLAADRDPGDPVAAAAGVPCKSLTPIDGIPMLFRVVNALNASREVDAINLCGPPQSIGHLEKQRPCPADQENPGW